MEVVPPYDVHALARPGGGGLALVEKDLLGDCKTGEVGGCRHTWVRRDLRASHNEVVGEGMDSPVEARDAVAAHT